jgi:hypothetical protein
MYIRQQFKTVAGKRRVYWALVESVRTERGPRQKVVSWMGALDEAGRLGVLQADQNQTQPPKPAPEFVKRALFDYDEDLVEPQWVRVNTNAVRVENCSDFNGPWMATKLMKQLKLDDFLDKHFPIGKEHIRWSLTSMILVAARLLELSSELYISEQWYPKTALPDLLAVPSDCVDDNRLYRGLSLGNITFLNVKGSSSYCKRTQLFVLEGLQMVD